jgi:hypothetical protein
LREKRLRIVKPVRFMSRLARYSDLLMPGLWTYKVSKG